MYKLSTVDGKEITVHKNSKIFFLDEDFALNEPHTIEEIFYGEDVEKFNNHGFRLSTPTHEYIFTRKSLVHLSKEK